LVIVKEMAESDQTIVAYLLNQLSEDDRERVEERYLGDQSLFEQLRAVEEELIEDYVKGDLSDQQRELFERHYLASEPKRLRVRSARQLVQTCHLQAPSVADDPLEGNFQPHRLLRPAGRQPLTLAFGVAAALLLLVASSLLIGLLRLRSQVRAARDERATIEQQLRESERQLALTREQVTNEARQSSGLQDPQRNSSQSDRSEQQRIKTETSPDQIVALVLTPGIRAVGSLNRALVSADTTLVEFRVNLEKPVAPELIRYRVVVKTVSGGLEVWTQEGLKPLPPKNSQVVVRVPAGRIRAAGLRDFTLTLSAQDAKATNYEEIESYYFQVNSK
jgi:hypothetical protein